MGNFIINLIDNYGYFGMFIGMVLEAIIIAIPSELILATGGILASKGIFTLLGAFITGLLGSIFCAIIIYYMGYFGGNSFIKKYGKYFFMKAEELEKSDSWFQKYGLLSALIGRNFPIIRTLISLPMGMTHQRSIPWTLAFVYAGYKLGENWIIINNYLEKLKVPIRILLVLIIMIYLIKKINKKK